MQLRVARLCLDCEELYDGSSCPVCASERFAFLSAWLPSEERRRWRLAAPAVAGDDEGTFAAIKRLLARWFGDPDLEPARPKLRTRASDHVPDLSFKEAGPTRTERAGHSPETIGEDRSSAS